ncbi:MAG: septal ring lytic transglycosylase RlpA family protein [Pseudomonadota bacterium]
MRVLAVIAVARRFALPLLIVSGVALAGCNGTIGALEPALVAKSDKAPKDAQGRHKIGKPYKVGGRWYHPKHDEDYDKVGLASWYGPGFHGRSTANGERFNQNALTAAHPTLPLPSFVRVTVKKTGKSAVLRVNDRGPFKRGRIIDVSKAAANELGFKRAGHAKVRVEYLGPAPVGGGDKETLVAARTFGKTAKTEEKKKGRSLFGLGRSRDDEDDAGAENVKVQLAATAPTERQKADLPGVARRYTERTNRPAQQATTATAYADETGSTGAIDAVIALQAEEPAAPKPIEAQPLPETASDADPERVFGAFDMFASADQSGISTAKPTAE